MKISALFVFAASASQVHTGASEDATPASHTVASQLMHENAPAVWGKPISGEDIMAGKYQRNGGDTFTAADEHAQYGGAQNTENSAFTNTAGEQVWDNQNGAAFATENEFSKPTSFLHGKTVTFEEDASTDQNGDRHHTEQNPDLADYDKVTAGYSNTVSLNSAKNFLYTPDNYVGGAAAAQGIANGYRNDDGSITETKHTENQIHDSAADAVGDAADNGAHGIREASKGATATKSDVEYDAGEYVQHHCIRRNDLGAIIEIVPYGWAGVGHGNKYCYLEHCNSCNDAKTFDVTGVTVSVANSEGNDEQEHRENGTKGKYCEMARNTQFSNAQGSVAAGGACGKHQFSDACTYVTCSYDGNGPMTVEVTQAGRQSGAHPEVSHFTNGKQHECRPYHNADNTWNCECKCATAHTGALPNHAVANNV